ncbi:MAG: serine/threonine protein kinase [Mycobacterium sp.]
METIKGLRRFEVQFNADGSLNTDDGGDGGVPEAIAAGGITDLFVMSHGWNNGIASARALYDAMFGLLADQLGDRRATSAAVGIIWPSILFPDDDPATASAQPASPTQVTAALAIAMPDQKHTLDELGRQLEAQRQDPAELKKFVALATGLVTTTSQSEEDSGESAILDSDAMKVLGHASTLAPKSAGNAQGVGNPFTKLWSGARELLRTMSYYEMKNRAGVIGEHGLGPLLGLLSGPDGPPRIHLIGHSFGARLVSYSLAGLPRTGTSPVKSLTLIQGAFSHFAFSHSLPFDLGRGGGLSGLEDRVDGPLLSTFTAADRAVGWWYPAASALARQDSQAGEDLTFRWGAMGHDGYQQNPAAQTVMLQQAGEAYQFERGRFYALDSNAVIVKNESPFSGAHSDIKHPEVTWAIAAAAQPT